MLSLQRPIIFFDLETTGTNVSADRIVEISIIKVKPDGSEYVETTRVNPGCHIPAEATAVHHITDADVAASPKFEQIAGHIAEIFADSDIAGFNSCKFDIPLLDVELRRAGIRFDFRKARLIDVQTIYHKKEPRNLSAAYRFYCGKDLEDAHSAMADTRATYEVLMAQIERYEDLTENIDQLSKFSSQNNNVDFAGRLVYNEAGKEVINFGKYKGRIAEDVLRTDQGYYNWVMQADFPADTKDRFTIIYYRIKQPNTFPATR